MLTDGAVQTGSGKLFQIRVEAEQKARLVNTVLSAGWESRWQSDDRSWRVGSVCSHSTGPIGGLADR